MKWRQPPHYSVISNVAVSIGIGFILIATFALHAFWMLQNHDVDFGLIVAQRIFTGGSYVTDYMEVNPPLIFLLDAPPALLAGVVGVDPYTLFSLYICLLVLLSTILAWPIVLWFFQDRPLAGRLLLLGFVAMLCFDASYEFGQREHLFVILFCPGLFWYAAREAGRPSPITPKVILIFVLAAIATLTKPPYLLIPAALLLLRGIQHRSMRIVLDVPIAVFAMITVAYVGLIYQLFPEFQEAARIQIDVYFAWNRAWMTVFRASRDAIAALCLAIVLTEIAPLSRETRNFLRYLCTAGGVSLIMALGQKKGWSYHLLPTLEISWFVTVFVAVSLLSFVRSQLCTRLSAGAVLGAIMLQTGLFILRPIDEAIKLTRERFVSEPLIASLHQLAAGRYVTLITSGFQMGFPSLAGVLIGGRAPGQILVPGTVKLAAAARNPEQHVRADQLRQLVTRHLIEDLQRYNPSIVAVDRRREMHAMPDNFDILGYYLASEDFRRTWHTYRLVRSIEGWDLYSREHAN